MIKVTNFHKGDRGEFDIKKFQPPNTTLALLAWRYMQGACHSEDIVGVEVVRRGRGSLV